MPHVKIPQCAVYDTAAGTMTGFTDDHKAADAAAAASDNLVAVNLSPRPKHKPPTPHTPPQPAPHPAPTH